MDEKINYEIQVSREKVFERTLGIVDKYTITNIDGPEKKYLFELLGEAFVNSNVEHIIYLDRPTARLTGYHINAGWNHPVLSTKKTMIGKKHFKSVMAKVKKKLDASKTLIIKLLEEKKQRDREKLEAEEEIAMLPECERSSREIIVI